jgi:glycosyltransferase involved in cell wall biosynthesis
MNHRCQTDFPCDRVWIVIPAYNEVRSIGRVLTELRDVGVQNVVVVDDGSSDATAETAARYDVWVLRHIVNRGQGAALQTGIEFAVKHHAGIIVTFDADGQHCVGDLPGLVEPIEQGRCEVVLGSRFRGASPGIPWTRKLLLKAAVVGTRLTTGLSVTDTHNGLRAMTQAAAAKIVLFEDGMAHASELLSKLSSSKLPWCEVPVTIRYSDDSLAKGQRNRAAFQIAFRMLIAKVVG